MNLLLFSDWKSNPGCISVKYFLAMDTCEFNSQALLNHLPNAVIFCMLSKHVISIHCSTRKKNISRNFQLQFQSMELSTHLWWQSLSSLYLAENPWGKQLSAASLSQERTIMITRPPAAFWLVNKCIWCLDLCKQVMAWGLPARPP